MTKRRLNILIVCLVVLGLALTAGAEAGMFSYSTGFQVQNLSGSAAGVTISYYNQSGTVVSTVTDSIPAASSVTYFPIDPASPFNGSVIVSSDQPIASIVNVLGDSGVSAASYVGSQSGSLSVSLPLLFKNNWGYYTWFNVQNTGSSTASVSVDYSDGETASDSIEPGASATFDQAIETHTEAIFAATVTSDQPVVVTVIEEDPSVMYAYSGFSTGSTNPVMPLVNINNWGIITGIQIQNIGSTSTDVAISYTPSSAGTACTETQSVPAGESKTFTLGVFSQPSPPPGTTTDCINGETFIGSAQVTGNTNGQDLVGIVNQVNPGVFGEAYGAFDPTAATDTVVLPLIMDRNWGYFTGFNVQNVGGGSTTVDCTFTDTTYTVSDTLAPGEALNDVQDGQIAEYYVGSATCVAGSGGKIVAVVNEIDPSGGGDQFLVYEGINVP